MTNAHFLIFVFIIKNIRNHDRLFIQKLTSAGLAQPNLFKVFRAADLWAIERFVTFNAGSSRRRMYD